MLLRRHRVMLMRWLRVVRMRRMWLLLLLLLECLRVRVCLGRRLQSQLRQGSGMRRRKQGTVEAHVRQRNLPHKRLLWLLLRLLWCRCVLLLQLL
jgi:hypothetical protein